MIIVTPALLAASTGCTAERAGEFAAPINEACVAYSISATQARLATFLAQVAHESGSLRYMRELASGEAYEGRADLGNTEPGDGPRYRGRGAIQTTGRTNYRLVRDRLRRFRSDVPDFEREPEALERLPWAVLSAADYWDRRGLNDLADRGDYEGITRRINGGLNGHADRVRRLQIARQAIADAVGAVPAPAPHYPPAGEADPTEATMPIAPIIGAVLPSIIESIPKLGKLFGSGSKVAERNIRAAEVAVEIVREATGAVNAQDAAERLKRDPAAVAAAAQAIEQRWLELDEAGGGGIAGARKADAEQRASADLLHSASFWIALALLPLVYGVVGSVVGLWGTPWPTEVRSAIGNGVVGMIVGALAGYYFGQTTSRNRTPGSAP